MLSMFAAMKELSITRGLDLKDEDVGQDGVAIKERRQCLSKSLLDCVDHTIVPPTTLGAARTSLIHKLHALLHGLWLILGSWSAMFAWADGLFSIASDQGTEVGLADAAGIDLPTFMPYLPHPTNREGTFDDLADDHGRPVAGFIFKMCLMIPEALHMCHGAALRMTDNLTYFEEPYFKMLEAVVTFLRDAECRRQFQAVCLGYADSRIESFTASLADWRWMSLVDAIDQVLKVEHLFRQHWKPDLMNARANTAFAQRGQSYDDDNRAEGDAPGRDPPPDAEAPAPAVAGAANSDQNGEDTKRVNRREVSKAIQSTFFWAYGDYL